MPKLLTPMIGLFLVGTAAQASVVEFYFSPTNSLSGVPNEYTANINPTVLLDQKAYLWVAVLRPDIWNGINMGWDQDVTGGFMYNPSWGAPITRRWETSSDFNPVPDDLINLVAVVAAGLGEPADPLHYFDAANNRGHYVLGELSFSTPAEVRMFAGGGGITRKGGGTREIVIFGRGGPNDPDLYVVPEPTGLLLLGIAAVALRRR